MNTSRRAICGVVVLSALILWPTPLLPPESLARAVQRILGVGWETAYLAVTICLQSVFYFLAGVLTTFAVGRAQTRTGRLLHIVFVPAATVALALAIRSVKAGHTPHYANAAVPLCACLLGTSLGLGVLYRRILTATVVVSALLVGVLLSLLAGTSSSLRQATEARLHAIVDAGPSLPSGDARFGALLQVAFKPLVGERDSAIERNRASILAWSIAVGHPKMARLTGLNPGSEFVRRAAAVSEGATLRGRTDWAKHYAVSAGLTVLGHPLISDAGGLMKEQLDALTGGSGFSFGDLAADRAGVRFAIAATRTERSAKAMQERITDQYSEADFFPPAMDLPENVTVEQFRRDFAGVGSSRYNAKLSDIEAQLDRCAALGASR